MSNKVRNPKRVVNKTNNSIFYTDLDTGNTIEIPAGGDCNIRTAEQTAASHSYFDTIPTGSIFKKVMERIDEVGDLLKRNESTVRAFLYLINYVSKDENTLQIHDKDIGWRPYTAQDLADRMGVDIQMARKHISRMKKANILGVVNLHKETYLCVNPRYVANGNKIPRVVAEVFNKKEEQ